MCKINEVLNYEGATYKRVSMATAKKLARDGGLELYMLPCKANLFSPWISYLYAVVNSENIEKRINEASYYNCNNCIGKYLHYYIKVA